MRNLFIAVLLVASLFVISAAGALAARNPSGTGPPSQTCGSATAPNTPGRSASAPGSAFNPIGTAGGVYNPGSQYDVACYQVSQSH